MKFISYGLANVELEFDLKNMKLLSRFKKNEKFYNYEFDIPYRMLSAEFHKNRLLPSRTETQKVFVFEPSKRNIKNYLSLLVSTFPWNKINSFEELKNQNPILSLLLSINREDIPKLIELYDKEDTTQEIRDLLRNHPFSFHIFEDSAILQLEMLENPFLSRRWLDDLVVVFKSDENFFNNEEMFTKYFKVIKKNYQNNSINFSNFIEELLTKNNHRISPEMKKRYCKEYLSLIEEKDLVHLLLQTYNRDFLNILAQAIPIKITFGE